jgi:hypothetical protein
MNKEKKTMLDELEKDSEGFDFKHFDKMLLARIIHQTLLREW